MSLQSFYTQLTEVTEQLNDSWIQPEAEDSAPALPHCTDVPTWAQHTALRVDPRVARSRHTLNEALSHLDE